MPGHTTPQDLEAPGPHPQTVEQLLELAVAKAKAAGLAPGKILLEFVDRQLELDKPGDRSERDRLTAVLRTDVQKLVAFAAHHRL